MVCHMAFKQGRRNPPIPQRLDSLDAEPSFSPPDEVDGFKIPKLFCGTPEKLKLWLEYRRMYDNDPKLLALEKHCEEVAAYEQGE